MAYTNPEDTIGKIVWLRPKNNSLNNTHIFKVKDVECSVNCNVARFFADSHATAFSDGNVYYLKGGVYVNFLHYDVLDATKEVLDHVKSKIGEADYYKLIEQEFSETAIKEVTLEEFQKNFPSYVPPAHTLHSSMKEDLKLVRKIQEGLEKLEKAPNQQNSLIVNKPQIKLSFL